MARNKRINASDDPIDVDRILAEHAATLREPRVQRVWNGWGYVTVPVTDFSSTFQRPAEVPGRTHNTMSARERRARKAAARAKKPGNRGGKSRNPK